MFIATKVLLCLVIYILSLALITQLRIEYCCDRKSRAACAQNFAPWQQATIEIMLAISLTIACSQSLLLLLARNLSYCCLLALHI